MIAFWWKVFINDRELVGKERSCIEELAFSNPINGSDTVTIKLADPEMTFVDDNIYIDNAPIRVSWGLHDTLFHKDFSGYISAIDITFPDTGIIEMTLTVMDGSHIMHRTKKKRTWSNTTNAAVVKQIASEYGFKCELESGYDFKTEETISQDNKTDLELIEDLAGNEDDKFYCKLIGDTIHYKKQGLIQDPVVGLTYRKFPYDLLSFSPQITIEDKKQDEETSDINTSTVETQTTKVDKNTADRDVQGVVGEYGPMQPKTYMYDPKVQKWSGMVGGTTISAKKSNSKVSGGGSR